MSKRKPMGVVLLLCLPFCLGAKSLVIQNKHLRAEVQSQPFVLRISDQKGRVFLESVGGWEISLTNGQKSPFDKGKTLRREVVDQIRELRQKDNLLHARLSSRDSGVLVELRIFFVNDYTLRVESKAIGEFQPNRFSIRFRSQPDDLYYGMGERYNSAQQKGNLVYNWTQEGCYINCKNTVKTYFPVPFFLNPKGYGFLLDDTHYSEFDFGKSEPGIFKLTNFNQEINFLIFYGPSPLEIIEHYTDYTGRIKVPPPWVFGVWNSADAGSLRAREVARITREQGIPTSALWCEDWANPVPGILGRIFEQEPLLWRWFFMIARLDKFEWKLNRSRYPDYEQLARELHQQGFKFLGYFMPYLGTKTNAFKEGAERGYLAKDPKNQPAVFSWIFPKITKIAQPDLTNPQARRWWEEKFFKKAVEYGVDGWMHDFSEYTPTWTKFADGRDGWAVHNDYPRLWALTAYEFWKRTRPDGDYVFFMRAGYTGSWKYAPVMWTGDSNMNWERYDGLPSTIPAVNSVGISGFPITSTDIAGYHCIVSPPSDKELFFRWTELGALLPVMRTHSSSGCDANWLFDSDQETLAHFKKYAKLHIMLFPYIYTLVHQSAEKGWPVVRHLMLHYPDDPGSKKQDYEFILGDRILVAPVIEKGKRSWEVYFPPGKWVCFWSGEVYQGPGRRVVPAPLGQIPIFVKNSSLLPIFDSPVDTLVREKEPNLKGWDDANQSIKVLFFGEGRDDYTLWDGTRFICDSQSFTCQMLNSPLPRKFSYEFR